MFYFSAVFKSPCVFHFPVYADDSKEQEIETKSEANRRTRTIKEKIMRSHLVRHIPRLMGWAAGSAPRSAAVHSLSPRNFEAAIRPLDADFPFDREFAPGALFNLTGRRVP